MSAGDPLAFFITFHTYGSWLHGDDAGSVDRQHNKPGEAFVEPDENRRHAERERQNHDAKRLDASERWIVHRTIEEVCTHRGWRLHAVHARTNHVHVVVTADRPPEHVMNTFKSWCTRRLVEHGCIDRSRRPWSRHGSTRWLWSESDVADKIDYVLHRQGAPLPMCPPPCRRKCDP
jgi:REP element-mobilizing transposase RayT